MVYNVLVTLLVTAHFMEIPLSQPQYIYSPRPKSKINPKQLDEMNLDGWLWQYKFNGDRCPVVINQSEVFLCNRHGKFLNRNMHKHIKKEFLSKSFSFSEGLNRLDGELISGNVLVLFDVLQYTNYLIGKKLIDRLNLLTNICGNPTNLCDKKIALQITDHIWLAECGDSDFSRHYQKHITDPLIEGLVLKQKDSVLDHWGAQEYEVNWQIRCRKPSKNYLC